MTSDIELTIGHASFSAYSDIKDKPFQPSEILLADKAICEENKRLRSELTAALENAERLRGALYSVREMINAAEIDKEIIGASVWQYGKQLIEQALAAARGEETNGK